MEKELPDGLIRNSKEFNLILAFPIFIFGYSWRTTYVLSFLDHYLENFKVNTSKSFLTGHSMGGFGT